MSIPSSVRAAGSCLILVNLDLLAVVSAGSAPFVGGSFVEAPHSAQNSESDGRFALHWPQMILVGIPLGGSQGSVTRSGKAASLERNSFNTEESDSS
jgi:hypothetical protein